MTNEKERDIDEAQGFEFNEETQEWDPIFELTPEQEHEFYAAGVIGPEGLTIAYSKPDGRQK